MCARTGALEELDHGLEASGPAGAARAAAPPPPRIIGDVEFNRRRQARAKAEAKARARRAAAEEKQARSWHFHKQSPGSPTLSAKSAGSAPVRINIVL